MNENLEMKVRNLTYIVVGGFIITFLLVIGLYFRSNNDVSRQENSNTTNTGTNNNTEDTYDASKFTEVDGPGAAALFKDKGTHILLISRPGCPICQDLVPKFNQIIDESGIEVNYLELPDTTETTHWNPEDWNDLYPYLDMETSINGQEGTYGELIKVNGFTPVVIIAKNGKMVDAFVGSPTVDEVKDFLSEYVKIK